MKTLLNTLLNKALKFRLVYFSYSLMQRLPNRETFENFIKSKTIQQQSLHFPSGKYLLAAHFGWEKLTPDLVIVVHFVK